VIFKYISIFGVVCVYEFVAIFNDDIIK